MQVNVFVNGETLLPQGYMKPFASGISATGQVLNGFGGADRRLDTTSSRMASLTLVRNLSGKRPAADFDFKLGGTGGLIAP